MFMEWMQQSYLPKGCLGDVKYYLNQKPGTDYASQVKNSLPHLYGAYSRLYMFLKKDAAGKFVPQNGLSEYWRIEANQLEYISNPVPFISTPEQYYFVMPYYHKDVKRDMMENKIGTELSGFATHKNIQAYTHFYIPPKIISDEAHYVVIMTPTNELPFEKVTIGEFFTKAEEQLPFWQKKEGRSNELLAAAKRNLARLKEKYKNRWNDVAELRYPYGQIAFYDFVNANEGNRDMFEHDKQITTFPILKVNKKALDLCKTDQPQWLVIRCEAGMTNQNYAIYKHESILNNFNFEYVYNYFFNPEKVKNIAYKPLRSSTYKEPAVITKASDASNAAANDKTIFFFEDFSTTATGKTPIGWNSNLTNGVKALVSETNEAEGNWVTVKGHTISPNNLKNPLPQNFEISFDVAAPKDFTWGAKRLDMVLAKENSPASYLRFSIKPGSGGREGETQVENNFGNGYENGTKYYNAPGFSNDKTINKAKIVIRKKGETLQVLVNNSKIADYPKAMPANTVFNFLQFSHGRSDGDTEKYFISNIKITKL